MMVGYDASLELGNLSHAVREDVAVASGRAAAAMVPPNATSSPVPQYQSPAGPCRRTRWNGFSRIGDGRGALPRPPSPMLQGRPGWTARAEPDRPSSSRWVPFPPAKPRPCHR